MGLWLNGNLTHGHMPCMKFPFVRPDVCRRLPSDSTSRWTPLPWAMRFPLLGLAQNLHPLANAHAERTIKKGVPRKGQSPFNLTCFTHYSPIPHGVAPQQSSTILQTANAKVQTLVCTNEYKRKKSILQFELLRTTTHIHPAI